MYRVVSVEQDFATEAWRAYLDDGRTVVVSREDVIDYRAPNWLPIKEVVVGRARWNAKASDDSRFGESWMQMYECARAAICPFLS